MTHHICSFFEYVSNEGSSDTEYLKALYIYTSFLWDIGKQCRTIPAPLKFVRVLIIPFQTDTFEYFPRFLAMEHNPILVRL